MSNPATKKKKKKSFSFFSFLSSEEIWEIDYLDSPFIQSIDSNNTTQVIAYSEQQKAIQDNIRNKIKDKNLTKAQEAQVLEVLKTAPIGVISLLDEEEFFNAIDEYTAIEKGGYAYCPEEQTVNKAANELFHYALQGGLSDKEGATNVSNFITIILENIDKIPAPECYRWKEIKKKLDMSLRQIKDNIDAKIFVNVIIELQNIMASWPPSLESGILKFKASVNTKLLNQDLLMNLFTVNPSDIQFQTICNTQVDSFSKQSIKIHRSPQTNTKVILKREEIKKYEEDFRKTYDQLPHEFQTEYYPKYCKAIDDFAKIFCNINTEQIRQEQAVDSRKKLIKSSDLITGINTLKSVLDEIYTSIKDILEDCLIKMANYRNPSEIEKINTTEKNFLNPIQLLLEALSIDNSKIEAIKYFDSKYEEITQALKEAPNALSTSVLLLNKSNLITPNNISDDRIADMFEKFKSVAEAYSKMYDMLNQKYNYLNQLDNFVLSLITSQEGDNNDRLSVLEAININTLVPKELINWQSKNQFIPSITAFRNSIEKVSSSKKKEIPSKEWSKHLKSFSKVFDSIGLINIEKNSKKDEDSRDYTVLGIATAIIIPINIITNALDIAQYNLKISATRIKVLTDTLTLCEKWYNAILKLKFQEKQNNIKTNLALFRKYSSTLKLPTPNSVTKELTVKQWLEQSDFEEETLERDLQKNLKTSLQKFFDNEKKKSDNKYALRVKTVNALIEKHITNDIMKYKQRKINVREVDKKLQYLIQDQINLLLKPYEEIYIERIKEEIKARNRFKGKAKYIKAYTPYFTGDDKLTTCRKASQEEKKAIQADIEYCLSQLDEFKTNIKKAVTDLDIIVYPSYIHEPVFEKIATARKKTELQELQRDYRNTYDSIPEEGNNNLINTTLKAIATTAKITNNTEKIVTNFIKCTVSLTNLLPDNDMKEANIQIGLYKSKQVVNVYKDLITNTLNTEAVLMSPPTVSDPLKLANNILGFAFDMVNLFIDNKIEASKARQHLSKLINHLEYTTTSLQTVRDILTGQQTKLSKNLKNLLEAKEKIKQLESA